GRDLRRGVSAFDPQGKAPKGVARGRRAVREPRGDARRGARGNLRRAQGRLEAPRRRPEGRRPVSLTDDAFPAALQGVTVRYGRVTVCEGITLSVPRGEVYALL